MPHRASTDSLTARVVVGSEAPSGRTTADQPRDRGHPGRTPNRVMNQASRRYLATTWPARSRGRSHPKAVLQSRECAASTSHLLGCIAILLHTRATIQLHGRSCLRARSSAYTKVAARPRHRLTFQDQSSARMERAMATRARIAALRSIWRLDAASPTPAGWDGNATEGIHPTRPSRKTVTSWSHALCDAA